VQWESGRLRVVVPTAVLWSLLFLVAYGSDTCLHVQRGALWPWWGSFSGVPWWAYANAIGVMLALLAHPIRPHRITAMISFARVSIWYCEGFMVLAALTV
jgi:hypothetical protein